LKGIAGRGTGELRLAQPSIYRILSLESLLLYHLINHQHIFNMRTAGLLVAALAATASVDAGVHR